MAFTPGNERDITERGDQAQDERDRELQDMEEHQGKPERTWRSTRTYDRWDWERDTGDEGTPGARSAGRGISDNTEGTKRQTPENQERAKVQNKTTRRPRGVKRRHTRARRGKNLAPHQGRKRRRNPSRKGKKPSQKKKGR